MNCSPVFHFEFFQNDQDTEAVELLGNLKFCKKKNRHIDVCLFWPWIRRIEIERNV